MEDEKENLEEADLLNERMRRVRKRIWRKSPPQEYAPPRQRVENTPPRTQEGRLVGAGYEAVDLDVGEPDDPGNRGGPALEDVGTLSWRGTDAGARMRSRQLLEDPDVREARELNAR